MGPRFLILETSGRAGVVALARGGDVLAQSRLDETRRHARDLAPTVAELLREQGWKPREVDAVIVSRGPGSYTGLRVGIMSAKTFAYATGCALIAVETFAAIALQSPDEGSPIDVLADAQQEKVYVQRFVRPSPGTVPIPESPLAIRTISEWLSGLEGPTWVSGPGLSLVEGRLPAQCRAVAPEDRDPRPESLLRIALDRYARGERDDAWSLEPLYLRPSSAEERWRGKGHVS